MKFESSETLPEKIEHAAIRLGEDVFTGRNHGEAFYDMEKNCPDWESLNISIEEGFTTNEGRFVDREQAGGIAKNARQLTEVPPSIRKEAEQSLDSNWVDDLRKKQ